MVQEAAKGGVVINIQPVSSLSFFENVARRKLCVQKTKVRRRRTARRTRARAD